MKTYFKQLSNRISITTNFILITHKKNFSNNVPIKLKEIEGIMKPFIKKKKESPKKELFYGLPTSNKIPKNKEDLIEKFKYMNSYDDMIDLFYDHKDHFRAEDISAFLERLKTVHNYEYHLSIKKSKAQSFIFKKESQIKFEYSEKIGNFIEDLNSFIMSKNFGFRELSLIYFEIMFRFRKEIPTEIIIRIFEESSKKSNFENNNEFKKLDLIKITYILSRHNLLLMSREIAVEGLQNVIASIIDIGISNLDKDEIVTLIKNLSFREVYPDFEIFTKFEPYILKYLKEYSVKTLISIFQAYVKNYLGSDFLLHTLGFSIAASLDSCDLDDLFLLLEVSDRKFYLRPELNFQFAELFLNIFNYIPLRINDLDAKNINICLKGIVNMSNNNKRFLHLLSTVYLKFAEREQFKNLVNVMNYFAVCDLDNTLFSKKILEVLSLNIVVLYHYMKGNDDLESLIGLYDQNFVKTLSQTYMKNIDNIKDKLRYFERIQYDEQEIFFCMDTLSKMMWTTFYFIHKIPDYPPEKLKEFFSNIIEIFNLFAGNLNSCEENGINILISRTNINKILQTYLYIFVNGLKFQIKQNLNLDFLKLGLLKVVNHPNEEIYYRFKDKVTIYMKEVALDTIEIQYEKDFLDISNYNLFQFLNGNFIRKIELKKKNDEQNKHHGEQVIFINDPYDYFHNSMNFSGFTKFRRHLCKLLKIDYLEIDFNEFLIFYKDIEINENNLDNLVSEFLQIKLN